MFNKVTEDREEHLKRFEEMAQNRITQMPALEDKSIAEDIQVLPAPEKAAAKKYEI